MFFSYIIYQSFTLIFKNVYVFNLSKIISGIFTGDYIVKWGSWYLYAIIGLYIISPFIYKMIVNLSDHWLRFFLLLLLVVAIIIPTINTYFYSINNTWFIFPFKQPFDLFLFSSSNFFYFIFGYAITSRNFWSKLKNRFLFIMFILSLLFGVLIHNFFYSRGIVYGQGFEISSLITVVVSICFFLLIKNNAVFIEKLPVKFKGVVNVVSGLSFGMYLFHTLILTGTP